MTAEDAKAVVATSRENVAITETHRTRARELIGLALGVGVTLDDSVELAAAKLAEADTWANAAFAACCYLDKAVPTEGMTNAERIRFAADEILRLREELAKLCTDRDRQDLARKTAAERQHLVEEAFLLGFMASREGFNGECAFEHCAPLTLESEWGIEMEEKWRQTNEAFRRLQAEAVQRLAA